MLPEIPLIWPAFPFHPHRPGEPWTNRAPNKEEIELGRPFIEEVLSLFSIRTVVAVGNVADKTLSVLDIEHEKIRHPSHGGKRDFQEGLLQVYDTLKNKRGA